MGGSNGNLKFSFLLYCRKRLLIFMCAFSLFLSMDSFFLSPDYFSSALFLLLVSSDKYFFVCEGRVY